MLPEAGGASCRGPFVLCFYFLFLDVHKRSTSPDEYKPYRQRGRSGPMTYPGAADTIPVRPRREGPAYRTAGRGANWFGVDAADELLKVR